MKKVEGFTLIELMIVIVIVAVLLMVALPAYQNSIIKSNRSAGRGILQDVTARQEQYYINNKVYSTTLSSLGYSVDVDGAFYIDNQVDKINAADSDSVYKIGIIKLSTLAYSVTAETLGRQAKDTRCGNFTITGKGEKSNSGPGGADECW
ncbi:MAG: hypothetical protein DRQ65_06085 [Gammaproteobacteria bacterium]|nr:MAG: hypothetical protein DRQ65_06085 [Gammaproteobacteria bacterium]